MENNEPQAAATPEEIQLIIDDVAYGGWKRCAITHSLDAIASTFDLQLTWKWQEVQNGQVVTQYAPIAEGKSCIIKIGEDLVLTGFIDDWIPSYDDKQVTVAVSGRSKTSDLVDCSVVHASGQFNKLTLEQIAKEICKPFSIDVVMQAAKDDVFARVQVEQGETCHEFLARLAKQRGFLLTTNAQGQLVITEASKERLDTALILGENILAGRGRFSWRERFSSYTVKTQGAAFGDFDSADLSTVGGLQAQIDDPDIGRYRPRIIVNDEIATAEGASIRGKWERQRALGESNFAEYTVFGWRIQKETDAITNPTGILWPINKLVDISDPIFGLDNTYLIKTVMFEDGDNGRITALNLVPPEAMAVEPQVEKTTKTKKGRKHNKAKAKTSSNEWKGIATGDA